MPSFDEAYLALRKWVTSHGWIEVGVIEGFSSMIRVLNEGGLIWEGEASYPASTQPSRPSMRQSPAGWRRNLAASGCVTISSDGLRYQSRNYLKSAS